MRGRLLLAACLVATACTAEGPPDRGDASPGASGLPLIALDPCPAAADLLDADARGEVLPAVTLDCLGDGPAVSLRRLGRLPTVLNLWASWCAPCRSEMPELQRVYVELKGRVRFLGVNTDDSPRAARETVQITAVSYPSVVDRESALREGLGGVAALGMPTTVLIDADGEIAAVLSGEKTADELRAAIADELGVTS